jgi:hypothetical protein
VESAANIHQLVDSVEQLLALLGLEALCAAGDRVDVAGCDRGLVERFGETWHCVEGVAALDGLRRRAERLA